jgi:hypothetical protein
LQPSSKGKNRAGGTTWACLKKWEGRDLPFYKGQLKTARFLIETVLPVTGGKMKSIQAASPAALEMEEESFGGL